MATVTNVETALLTAPSHQKNGPSRACWSVRRLVTTEGFAFATALASADKILLSLGPQGQQLEARLAVTCRTAVDAAALTAQLQRVTALLQEMIARENQRPDPKDLSGVLTAGVFQQAGRRVMGRWPLPPVFLESLAGGAL